MDIINGQPASSEKNNALTELLYSSGFVSKNLVSSTTKVATWILMADIYATLSLLHSNRSLFNAERALNEAIKCVERAQTVVEENQVLGEEDLKTNPAEILDADFIRLCNSSTNL